MKSRVIGVLMCASLFAMTVLPVTSAAKEQGKQFISAIQGGVDPQQKPQSASQGEVVSVLEVERIKKRGGAIR